MTNNILEWGWHTSIPTSSTASDWKPANTLLSGANATVELAAAGDLKCQGVCGQGGSYGTTAAYNVENKSVCRSCAVKRLGIEGLPGNEQDRILKNFELRGQ